MIESTNAIIIITIISLLLTQFIKFCIHAYVNKKFDEKIFFSTGGMPSSHSALVTSLVVSIGLFQYHDNNLLDYPFVVSLVLALVVIHDSMGIRYESSKHARELNQIKFRLNLIENIEAEEKKLKEALGHKPVEVLIGVILGAIFGIIGFLIFRIF